MPRASLRPFLGGVAALCLAWLGQRSLRAEAVWDGAALLLAAAVLFVVALGGPRFAPETPWPFPRQPLPAWRSPRLAWAGMLLAAAAVAAVFAWRAFDASYPASTVAWLQHGISVALALLAALVADGAFTAPSGSGGDEGNDAARSAPWHTIRWRNLLLTGGLLALMGLLALLLRLYRLDTLPFGAWYDEATYGLQALHILADPDHRLIFEGAINGPAHYLYLVALAFQAFGASTESIRLVNALLGVGAVLAGYGVGYELFGKRIGLLLAALLAASIWLVTLSRLGMHSTSTTPFFTLITVWLLLRALRTGRLWTFALAGLGLGLGLCFYTSFRLFVPVVGLFLLLAAWHEWRRQRHPPGLRFWAGAGLLTLTALLVTLPLLWFAQHQPDVFWARVQDTYIFANKTEAERLPALLASVGKHLAMFNYRGDPNGRHNLPGAPMLDDFCAALFVLGVAYSLRRLREPRLALLPLWLGFTLLGGILSLDFEAPQSLRANGALGAAYVLAVLPLAVLVRAWEAAAPEYARRIWWAVGGLVVLVLGANLTTYFWRQANDFATWAAHSAAETMTAQMINRLDAAGANDLDVFITTYYFNHPTLRFLIPTGRPLQRLETTAQLPLEVTPGHGALLVMNPESHALFDVAMRIYPDARFDELHPPMPGPPVLYTVRLSPADVESVQGLDGNYYANARHDGEPAFTARDRTLDFDWAGAPPLPEPFSVEWRGVLHAPVDGLYQLALHTPAAGEVAVGEQVLLAGTGPLTTTLRLAQGNHALRVRAVGGPGAFQLLWQPPGATAPTPVPATALYSPPITANGLLARYFPNATWEPPDVLARIEDQLDYYVHRVPLSRPYTVEYTGKVAIPAPGSYAFGLNAVDAASLSIGGQEVVRTAEPDVYAEGRVDLEAGLHDLQIRFSDTTGHTHLRVFWMPPGGTRAILPAAVLFPPQGAYQDITLPSLDSVIQRGAETGPVAAPPANSQPAPLLGGTATLFAQGLQQPRGIALAPDGRIYVAEGGSGKLQVFDAAGNALGLLPQGAETIGEPSDVAVDSSSDPASDPASIVVLDAAIGRVWRFALDGSAQPDVVIDGGLAQAGRGLTVGPDGRVWVASTARSVLAGSALDANTLQDNGQDGGDPITVALTGGEGAQPTDVVVGQGGALFVADPVRQRLDRYSPFGTLEQGWPLPIANTLDSPHLAVDAAGRIYVTDPEAGRVELRDHTGEAIGAWDVAGLLGHPVKLVGIAVAPDGALWLTDSTGGSVIVLRP